jgi:tetratricopeptide (TPR) repeat protein
MKIRVVKFLGAVAVFASCSFSMAQGTDSQLRNAFSKSYVAESNGQYAKAIEELELVKSNPSYEMQMRLGWLNYLNIKFKESAVYYKKAIEISPKSIEAKFGYIYAISSLEKWDEVIQVYKSILSIEPTNYKANYNLALIYYNRKEYQSGLSYINTILANYPMDFEAVNLGGWLHYFAGKKDVSTILFKKALLLNPSSTLYNEVLGIK